MAVKLIMTEDDLRKLPQLEPVQHSKLGCVSYPSE